MEKLKIQYIILLVLVILGFAFYWFEYRPAEIRKKCSTISSYAKNETEYYQVCLRDNGLKE